MKITAAVVPARSAPFEGNIYDRSRRAGERVMASVSRFLTKKLRLKVNEAKSAVARPEERKFLGFSISNDGSERRIAPKALDKFKTQIREMTRRTRGISLTQLIEELSHTSVDGAATSVSARPHVCSRTWKRGYAEDYARIFGGSGGRLRRSTWWRRSPTRGICWRGGLGWAASLTDDAPRARAGCHTECYLSNTRSKLVAARARVRDSTRHRGRGDR